MWRLWNYLFGWHYVTIQFAGQHLIRIIKADGDGRPYVIVYNEHIDLRSTIRTWYPLTCSTAAIKGQ